jgi:hypothetical protein
VENAASRLEATSEAGEAAGAGEEPLTAEAAGLGSSSSEASGTLLLSCETLGFEALPMANTQAEGAQM